MVLPRISWLTGIYGRKAAEISHSPIRAISTTLSAKERFLILSEPVFAMLLTNLFLLFALWIGFCWLMIAFVNRIHACNIPHTLLKKIRKPHDVLIPLSPVIILLTFGVFGSQLLRGGTLQNAAIGYKIAIGVLLLGMIGFAIQVVQFWIHSFSSKVKQVKSEVIDFEQQLGKSLAGEGKMAKMTSLPGNQVFQVEFNTKTFAFKNLPREWEGLRILHISDLHFFDVLSRDFFDAVFDHVAQMEVDIIVFSGDLVDQMKCLEWLPTTLGKLSCSMGCYYILGNHDWNIEDVSQVRKAINQLGWIDIASECKSISIEGRTLLLGGSEYPWMGYHPDFDSLSAENHFKQNSTEEKTDADDAFRLFVCHTPDHFCWAKQHGIDLMLSGHNHGGQIRLPVIGPIYAPSRYGVRYASGDYWSSPTLMHVSRGLSAYHPLRINCRPEITILELVCENTPPIQASQKTKSESQPLQETASV